MSEPITGELRRRMDTLGWYDEDGSIVITTGCLPAGDVACLAINSKTFDELCDRIDAEHERELRETGEEIVRDVRREWVRLPVDADGVPIHIGDVMEWVDIEGTVEVVCTVDAVGVGCFFAWDAANCRYAQKCANAYRHHHAPTVEDVLRGVVTLCRNTWKEGSAFEFYDVDDVMKSGNIAEYAAKLRLAEGEDA